MSTQSVAQAQETETIHKRKIEFSADGHFVATSFSDFSVQVQNRDTQQLVLTYLIPVDGWLELNDIQFSPDGEKLAISFGEATAGSEGKIFIISIPDGTLLSKISINSYAGSLAWQPDGLQLAVTTAKGMAGSIESFKLLVWNTEDWSLIQEIELPNRSLSHLSWSPDGQTLAVTNGDEIQLFATSTWQVAQTLLGHSEYIRSIDWNNESTQVVTTSSDQSIRIWDAASGRAEMVFTREVDAEFTNLVFWSKNGQDIIAFGEYSIEIWNALTGEKELTTTLTQPEWIKDAAQSPDKTYYLEGVSENIVEVILPSP